MPNEPGPLGQQVPPEALPASAAKTEDVNIGRPEPRNGPSLGAAISTPSQRTFLPPAEGPPEDGNAETLSTATSDGRRAGGPGGGPGRRSRSAYADLTTGSIPRHLWRLSWPQVAESVLNIVDQMVDMVWAGRLPGGFRALAGLGVAQTFTQFGFMARQGLDQATRAMITRAVGAGNIPLANRIALQAFTLTGVYSVVIVLVGLFLTDILIRGIGASEAVQAEAAMYMRIQFVGIAGMSFRMASTAMLQSAGDVMTPLKSTTVTRVIHIVLTPFFMFGWLGFPAFGLAGAALSNLLAQLAGGVINFYVLFYGGSPLRLTLRGYRLDYPMMWRLVKIGTPASVAGMERAISQLVLLGIVVPFGDVALAAYGLTRRVEMFANFGGMGVGQAAGIMVGQNLGAGRPDRARQSVGWALAIVSAMKLLVGAPLLLFPVLFVIPFTSEAAVVSLTATWLQILVFGALLMGLGIVFQQAFNVAGDTVTVMIVTFVALVAIELPAAWLLSHYLRVGPLGIAWAHVIGMGVRAAIFVPVYFWGRWLRVKVI